MRVVKLLVLALVFCALPSLAVRAQDEALVYRVGDVTADVTAASASVARDHAIIQAQRHAFSVLLQRLGASEPSTKPTDEALGALVQAFEIQKEHAMGLRYTATFSIQFKPSAVRQWLDTLGVKYSEDRALPVVVLPVVKGRDQTVLWEDFTPWRSAWAEGIKNAALVPFIVPPGDLDDIAQISTAEAVAGKAEALEAIMKRYGAAAALVTVVQTDFAVGEMAEKTVSEARIETTLYKAGGEKTALPPSKVSWTSAAQRTESLVAATKALSQKVEEDWRQSNKTPSGVVARLPVDVAVPTLAAFAQIKQRLAEVPAVADAQVISMTRGLVHIELSYRGEIAALQEALTPQNLALEQGAEGGWILRQTVVE